MNGDERLLELEESAEGVELFRPPGYGLQQEKARDQAEASGWIPEPPPTGATPRLDAVARRRRRLRAAMDRLEEAIARPLGTVDWLATVERTLTDLRSALVAHIAETEGPDGLLAEIVELAPRLGAQVDDARDEHVALLRAVDRALAEAHDDMVSVPSLRRRGTTLLGRLTIHRHRGAELLYEAYDVDIGSSG